MAQLEKLIPLILKWEGGYVNDPVDSGGPTKMGVTLKTWIPQGISSPEHLSFPNIRQMNQTTVRKEKVRAVGKQKEKSCFGNGKQGGRNRCHYKQAGGKLFENKRKTAIPTHRIVDSGRYRISDCGRNYIKKRDLLLSEAVSL